MRKNGVVIFLNYNESQDSITSKLKSEKITALKKSTDLRKLWNWFADFG